MEESTEKIRKSACYFCHQQCGMLVHIKGNEITSIEGDPEHPSLGGKCPRANIALKHHNHPARVNYPLKRAGERGQGKWEKISWEQALDEISAKLEQVRRESGAEFVCSAGGTQRTHDWARRRFMNLFGSPNVFHISHVCWIPTFMIETAICGWSPFDIDLQRSRCVVLWGHNPGESYMPEMRAWTDAKKNNGLKIIVIDPRMTESAAKADLWLPLRPGTDAAMALAWLNVIINEGLHDQAFVENWCSGWEQLVQHVQPYTPEWAAPITWVDAEKIRAAARMYATFKPGNIQWGVAVDEIGKPGGAAMHARALLRAVTGNLDAPGGDLLIGPNPAMITDEEMECNDAMTPEKWAKQIGSERYKLVSWPGYSKISEIVRRVWGKAPPTEWMCEAHGPTVFDAILTGKPYKPRALLVLANNTLLSYPNTKKVYQALKELELITVMDYWLTPTAMLADYVLPCADWLERPTLTNTYGCSDFVICSERAVPPLYERRTDYEFWKGLGDRLAQSEFWPWQTLEEAKYYRIYPLEQNVSSYDEFVEQVRFSFPEREFYKYGRIGFATPSGKVELYSQTLEALGFDPMPKYIGPAENEEDNPELSKEFPLVLIAGSGVMPYYHSEHRNIKNLRYLHPEPRMQINPATARQLNINNGDWAWIETKRGKIMQVAELTEQIHPRMVFIERGWWFPERDGREPGLYGLWQSNANILTSGEPEHCDRISGSWANRGLLCRVYKVAKEDLP
jgi:anaerobic selenocysteine-containing dehydrogenase